MFKLDYKLDDHGWADARIQLGKYVGEATASYLEDTLGDLASETLFVLNSEAAVAMGLFRRKEVIFEEEGSRFRLSIKQLRPGLVRLKLAKNHSSHADEVRWYTKAEVDVQLDQFAREVERVLAEIYSAHGAKGYKDKWVAHDFPLEIWRAIRKELDLTQL
jgi:hypothetical protein